eukprot:GDKJ01015971.1.p1 GENE.GDKJ01015971.1~~GDKJ01015971.1.p1  ORF type:complete len:1097 (+),score=274.85 GDKJ01015971.1:163-3291(+)
MKTQSCMESYRGTDWILHSSTPSHKGFEIYGYSRSQVKKQADLFNMLVLTWSPRSKSAVHNHPCERCFLMPLQGDLAELKYNVNDETGESTFVDDTPMLTNRAYWIDDKQGWHSVHNRSCGLSVSLHVYIPAFVKCKIIDPLSGRIKEVSCYPSNVNRVLPLHDRIFEHLRDYVNSLDKPADRPVLNLRSVQDIEEIFKDKCAIEFDSPMATDSSLFSSYKNESCLNPPTDDDSLLSAIQNTLDFSTNTGHLFFFNQLLGRAEPLAIAADALVAALNPNMLTFETAPVFMMMEKRLLEHLAAFIGWFNKKPPMEPQSNSIINPMSANCATEESNPSPAALCHSLFLQQRIRPYVSLPLLAIPPCRRGCLTDVPTEPRAPRCHWSTFDGIINPGGALSNMIAMHIARYYRDSLSKYRGNSISSSNKGLVVFMSEQGHESFEKGCALLGLGSESLVRIPVDPFTNKMDVYKLEIAVKKVKEAGYTPFFVAAHAGTTVAGCFDDFVAIRKVCDEYNMWMHIDGTLGASYLLCRHEEPYASMCEGIEYADSISWNLHKLLGVPMQCAALLTKHAGLLKKAHAASAVRTFSPYVMISPKELKERLAPSASFNSDAEPQTPSTPGTSASAFPFKPHFHAHNENGGIFQSAECMATTSCTPMAGRRADSFKAWLLWKKLGDLGMANRVRLAHSLSIDLAEMIKAFPYPPKRKNAFALRPESNALNGVPVEKGVLVDLEGKNANPNNNNNDEATQSQMSSPSFANQEHAFELVWMPHSVNVCFWWIPEDLRCVVAEIKTRMTAILAVHQSRFSSVLEIDECKSTLLTMAFHLLSGLLPPVNEEEGHSEEEVTVAVLASRLYACLDLIAPYIKVQLLAEGSVMVAHHAIPNMPPVWRLAIINPELSRADLKTVLKIFNRTASTAFPFKTFDTKTTVDVINMTHDHEENEMDQHPQEMNKSVHHNAPSLLQPSLVFSPARSSHSNAPHVVESVSIRSVPQVLPSTAQERLGGLLRVPAVAPELKSEEKTQSCTAERTRGRREVNCEYADVDA